VSDLTRQEFTQELDLKGLSCPLPLLKMKLALKKMEPGQIIYVETSDSGSWQDFHKFTKITDNELISAQECDSYYQFVIKKGS
jgi:tRNA 2-thiouridine synthesizing protein A